MSKKQNTVATPFLRFLFLIYCAVMLWLLFNRPTGWIEGLTYRQMLRQNINLIPFLTIRNYLHVIIHRTNSALISHCIINLCGNIFLFIPAGWLLPRLFPKTRNYFRFFLTCFLSILLIETLQLFTLLGSFDIDDLILNLFGMTLGFIFFHICSAGKKKKQ